MTLVVYSLKLILSLYQSPWDIIRSSIFPLSSIFNVWKQKKKIVWFNSNTFVIIFDKKVIQANTVESRIEFVICFSSVSNDCNCECGQKLWTEQANQHFVDFIQALNLNSSLRFWLGSLIKHKYYWIQNWEGIYISALVKLFSGAK